MGFSFSVPLPMERTRWRSGLSANDYAAFTSARRPALRLPASARSTCRSSAGRWGRPDSERRTQLAEGASQVTPEPGADQEHPDEATPTEWALVDFVVTKEDVEAAFEEGTDRPVARGRPAGRQRVIRLE
jgi:hypothetical protein